MERNMRFRFVGESRTKSFLFEWKVKMCTSESVWKTWWERSSRGSGDRITPELGSARRTQPSERLTHDPWQLWRIGAESDPGKARHRNNFIYFLNPAVYVRKIIINSSLYLDLKCIPVYRHKSELNRAAKIPRPIVSIFWNIVLHFESKNHLQYQFIVKPYSLVRNN